ncbi:MAG: ABC transporter permease subunit, partial [Leptospiraceae bacterium]|nr:ABC transporter permease subunit [Leptospiraceae bacterium]
LEIQILENSLLFLSRLILSTPIFVVSILLFLFFFLYLGILPPGGYEAGNIMYLILPGIALGSRVFARIFYISLDEGKKEKDSDYFFFLQTRGFSRARIVFYYIFRKIFPLILIFILIDFSSLLSGSILVEEIFFFPGIGKSLYYAVKSLDENLLRALLFYSGIVFYILTRTAKKLQFKLSME